DPAACRADPYLSFSVLHDDPRMPLGKCLFRIKMSQTVCLPIIFINSFPCRNPHITTTVLHHPVYRYVHRVEHIVTHIEMSDVARSRIVAVDSPFGSHPHVTR